MSLEERIDDLITAIEELTAAFVVTKDDVIAADDLMYPKPGDVIEVEGPDYPKVISSLSPSEHPDWSNLPLVDHTEPETEIVPANSRTIELMDLSKEMGFEYLLEGDQLAVDNRVIDEYHRRKLGDGA